MKRIMCLLLVPALAAIAASSGTARGDELKDPVEILKKLDAAAKAVTAASYDFTVKTIGAAKGMEPDIEGFFFVAGNWTGNGPEKFLADVKVQRRDYQLLDATVGCDGESCYLIDHVKKSVSEGSGTTVFGQSARYIFTGITGEFIHPQPFTDEINGKKQELLGTEMVGGEECYIVRVTYNVPGPDESKALWYISKKDFLPRARNDVIKLGPTREGGRLRTMTNLVINPKINENTFKAKVPEGYKGAKKTEKDKP